MNFLSIAIARVCVELDGLQIVQLPGGLDEEHSVEIVRAANAELELSPPFAILVGSDDDLSSDPMVPRVSRRNAIMYRRGDRLAVVSGSSVDLASFDNSFRRVVGPGFPLVATDVLNIPAIAPHIVGLLIPRLGVAVDASVLDECAQELVLALGVLASCYERATDTTSGWNGLWFKHVERGLSALEHGLRKAAKSETSEPFGQAFQRLLWSSFGLPREGGNKRWSSERSPREFMDALSEFWGDYDAIQLTLAQLREAVPGTDWRVLAWEDYEAARIHRDSALGALQEVVSRPEALSLWAEMDLPRFIAPIAKGERLEVLDLNGRPLNVQPGDSPAVIVAEPHADSWRSAQFMLRVRSKGPLEDAELDDLGVRVSAARVTFVVTSRQSSDEAVLLRGYLEMPKRPRLAPVSVKISLSLTPGSGASGRVAAKAQASAVVVLTPVGALAWPTNGRLGKPVYVGPENAEDASAGGSFSADLTRESEHFVATWGGVPSSSSVAMSEMGLQGLTSARVAKGADFEIAYPDSVLTLQGASGGSGFVTPLAAAATKSSVDLRPMDEEAASVRGLVERELADSASPLLSVLGHFVVPADGTPANTEFHPDPETGVAACDDYALRWFYETGMEVPQALRESPEAKELVSALAAIRETVPAEGRGRWPSRTSWRHLAGSTVLDRYLTAYASLVERCSDEGHMARFWACFPFSVSVWDGNACQAVLLTPLHPIRLAWLASAEAALFGALNAESLAGTIEGWQFPCIAPAPTPSGRVVAIPSDSGHEQVFAAWSMMVPVSTDQNDKLRSPARALGRPAPGTSPSGLTASAAEAAMRDYLRANPYVPSLTIDLAASTDTARLREVDEAVIGTIQESARSTGWWGIRVLDSVHRTGDLPRARLAQLMSDARGARSLTWSRYRPAGPRSSAGAEGAQRSNMRLLQDSGAEIRSKPAGTSAPQVAGRTPLRRFSAGDVVEGAEAFRAATLASTGWLAFDRAVGAVEANPVPRELGIKLSQSYLMDRQADWTVSGEAFLSPAAMSALVAAPIGHGRSRGDRVLWEWRPPYLQGKHGGSIDRRPYVTVARVSPTLRANLARKLEDVTGWTDSRLDAAVSDVLLRLGTQGLGLSSLLTRGGTHESGALGFYLAYGLLERGADEGATDVVLPLDACDTFLTALGGRVTRNSAKRADLLLMRFVASELVLVPIEIKFYGSGSVAGYGLPKPGSLKEALGQLRETTESLRRVVERANDLEGADRTLWYSAFATLVESGLNLGQARNQGKDRQGLLTSVVSGSVPVRLGQPLVLYFAHEPDAEPELHIYRDEQDGSQTFGALIGRPNGVFDYLAADASVDVALTDDVRTLLSWATAPTAPLPAEAEPPAPPEAPEGERSQDQPRVDFSVGPEVWVDAAVQKAPKSEIADKDPQIRPSAREGIRFPVGRFVGSIGKSLPEFWPSNTALNQLNVGVVGDLGTGKTQLLQAMILNLRRSAAAYQQNPLSMLVLDYKRDFQRPEFLSAVGGVVLQPHDIPLNPFELDGEYSNLRAYEKAKDFCDVLERIYSGVGPVQRQRLTTAIMDSFSEHPESAPTLSEVLDRYQLEVAADSVTSILRDFVMREIFVDGRGPTTSFDELLENKVVVLALNELGNDKDGKNALVALFLNQYYAYMLRRTKWPVEGHDPSLRRLNSYLLVDEAVNIMRYDFEVLENLLLQGREFGVGVMLSSQFLSHFRTSKKNWAEPLLTWFIHKVPHVSVKDLERIGLDATEQLADQIGNLEVHEAVYKSLGVSGRRIRGNPFYEVVSESDSYSPQASPLA